MNEEPPIRPLLDVPTHELVAELKTRAKASVILLLLDVGDDDERIHYEYAGSAFTACGMCDHMRYKILHAWTD